MEIVFCFGLPKSGTTFLQMILNNHPEVSCPSEHEFDYLLKNIKNLLEKYNGILYKKDQKTAKQYPAFFQSCDAEELFIKTVELAAKRGANHKPVKLYGLKDNTIIRNVHYYACLFPQSKFICVVRDPRGITISSWHHNIRTETDFLKRAINLEKWSDMIANIWNRDINKIKKLRFHPTIGERLLFCRYEDLVNTPMKSFKRIFQFLQVNCDRQTIIKITDAVNINSKKNNPFFRKGQTGDWETELTETIVNKIVDKSNNLMKYFEYI